MEEQGQEIVLVRHGDTEWSKSRKHTGRTDIPLSPEGLEEAAKLRPILAEWHFDVVLTSPLGRARTTCALAGFGDVAQPRDDLMEWNYGAFEGRLTTDIRKEWPGWSIWRDGVVDGESAEDVGRRCDRVLEEVRGVKGHILMFGHAHLFRVLTARWLGLAPTEGRLFMMETAAIGVLGYEREQPVIIRWNEHHSLR